MDVANGFDTGFSFYYAAAQPGSVTVYDGLDGTGNVLATLSLPATPSPYSQWEAIGVSFWTRRIRGLWRGRELYRLR